MIHVDRSAVPVPAALVSALAVTERERVARLLQSSSKAHLRQLRISFKLQIWKETHFDLTALFHGKCAYCESRIATRGFGGVEHFRPKQGARNLDDKSGSHLHYAWLAYEWDNLLLACINCSRRRKEGQGFIGKADYFPVDSPRAPLLASVADCRRIETALLLDPTFDWPEQHLVFHADGLCGGTTRAGQVTIDLLGLNRKTLVDARRTKWFTVQNAVEAVAVTSAEGRAAARRELARLLDADAEYIAAGRAALAWARREYGDVQVLSVPRAAALAEATPELTPSAATPSPPKRYEKRERLPPFAHQRIHRIEIRNFKAIESLDFDLRDPLDGDDGNAGALMLLGENATGKSTVLEAVALTLLGTRQIHELGLPAEELVRREDWNAPLSEAEPASVRVFFEGTETPVELTIDPRKKKFTGNKTPATVLLAYGPRRFFSDARGLRRSTQPHARVETLCDPLAVITNPNGWLMNSPDALFNPTVRALRQILVLPDEALVERPAPGKRAGAEMMFEVQGKSAPLNRLSEGYKTVVATGVDIMREMLRYWPDLETARGVVLIDEIETHLHPRWKMRIVQRLRRAMPQVQFIATTHDPLCLRGMYDGEVQVLAHNAQRQIERLHDVPNVRGLSVEQLLMSDYFGLFSTEDPAIEEALTRYVALASKHQRSPDEEEELARHRQVTGDRLVLGNTPQTQVVQEAVSRYLLERRAAPATARADLKRESIRQVVDIWKSLGPEPPE